MGSYAQADYLAARPHTEDWSLPGDLFVDSDDSICADSIGELLNEQCITRPDEIEKVSQLQALKAALLEE